MKSTYVLYVNVASKSSTKAKEKLEEMKSSVKEQIGEDAIVVAIPIKDGDTRIEILSGASILDESFKSVHNEVEKGFLAAQKMFEKVTERIESTFKSFKDDAGSR